MANGQFISLESGRRRLKTAINQTTGAPDANKIIRTGADGRIDPSFIPNIDVNTIVASEALDAGDFVNIFDDGGTISVRKADASNDRRAHGFVTTAVAAAANATVFREGSNTALSGLTIGVRYYLDTAGGVTTTPKTASNEIHQYLGLSVAVTEINIEITDEIVIE